MNTIPNCIRPATAFLAFLSMTGAAARAQQGLDGVPPEAIGREAMPLSEAPVATQLGARVVRVARAVPTIDAVVVVPDDAAYVAAVSSWTLRGGRFPVLIDDGTPEAAEAIGRFVRAFAPSRVVRWDADAKAWPDDPAERFKLMNLAALRVWSLNPADPPTEGDAGRFVARFNNLGFQPPGIVVIDPRDPGWAAGLALAAGRGQPMMRYDGGNNPQGNVDPGSAANLQKSIEGFLESLKLGWNSLGDAIDAITLSYNVQAKCAIAKPGDPNSFEIIATTDLIGRKAADPGTRFAWCGQIFSTSTADAASRAMSSLFLQPTDAFLFDGYDQGQPWETFDATVAGELLKKAQISASVVDYPAGTEKGWRERTRTPVRAGLVFVNTMGNADFFQLQGGGQCKPGDVPILDVPAAVHFVHSWSATEPMARGTVAQRWLERGAFCYLGSVQEPYLQAFVPTPLAAARLCSAMPWGAAVRIDNAPVWKLTVIGDPLYTLSTAFGPEPARAVVPERAEGATATPVQGSNLADAMRQALKDKKLEDAARLLVMLGRDKDAADLGVATLQGAPQLATSSFCASVIPPMFRAGRLAEVVRAYAKLDTQDQARGDLKDFVWFAATPTLIGKPDQATLTAMKLAVREDQIARDATELGLAWARGVNKNDAVLTLEGLMGAAKSPEHKKQFESAIKAVRASR